MRSMVRQIAALALLLLVVCVAIRVANGNAYTAYLSANGQAQAERLEGFTIEAAPFAGDRVRVRMVPRQRGRADLRVDAATREFRVGPLMTVYDVSTGGFTGDNLALIAATAFFLLVAAIMIRYYRTVRGPAFYAHATIYAAGFSLFSLLTGVTMGYVTIQRLTRPASFMMLNAYDVISRAGYTFMLSTAPLVALFAAAMTVSNIVLMRHERTRLKNALGILAGLLLIAGEAVAILIDRSGMGRPGPEEDAKQLALFLFPTVFVYFECVLIGAILCGVRAARHVPTLDREVLIVLGCWFKPDGTLTPLLQGRVDKAVEFWTRQRDATGLEATVIPSGGQGRDEPMPEAEAMANYMIKMGVPESRVIRESGSHSTYQNMAYSKAIIDRARPGARAAYVTTNYHVFRAGVWANQAGLPAEGIGSATRWWYWPNAFMRECAGLLVHRWRQEALGLLVLILFFGTLAALL